VNKVLAVAKASAKVGAVSVLVSALLFLSGPPSAVADVELFSNNERLRRGRRRGHSFARMAVVT
jgi:hypothetical protein